MLSTILNNSLQYTNFCQFQLLVLYLLSQLLYLRIRFAFPEFLLTICFYYPEDKKKKTMKIISLFQASQALHSVQFCL